MCSGTLFSFYRYKSIFTIAGYTAKRTVPLAAAVRLFWCARRAHQNKPQTHVFTLVLRLSM